MAKKTCKGWKVIRRIDRRSCIALVRPNASVTYIKNKATKRRKKHGPLAVFETRKAARKFVFYRHYKKYNWRIVKCIYIRSKSRRLWEWATDFDCIIKGRVPERTDFADSVTCLE